MVFFINPKPSFSIWFKYENNSIIPKNVDKKEQIVGARGPSVLLENNVIKMWFMNYYQNKWSLDYIYSNDGLNWFKPYEKPILLPDNEESDIASPVVINEDGVYKLWYSTMLSDGKYYIKYATSLNGIIWNVYPTPVLSSEFYWESKGVVNPYVLKKNSQYYLWYQAWGNDSIWRIGLATSNDGINWSKNQQPIYLKDNILHVGNQNLKIVDYQFNMWYLTGNSVEEKIYRYVSDDGINWHCLSDSCLIIEKQSPEFPNSVLDDSDTLIFNNNIYLYYSGVHNGEWQIGLATEKPLNLTPTPSPRIKVVIIPGLFASWNKEAILHNEQVNFDQWKLPSFIHDYDGLINTLKNLGFKKK